jgi:hypothetical protein
MCENMGLNPIGRTEQLVEQNGAACGAERSSSWSNNSSDVV